jgi:hypothetical protein
MKRKRIFPTRNLKTVIIAIAFSIKNYKNRSIKSYIKKKETRSRTLIHAQTKKRNQEKISSNKKMILKSPKLPPNS